MNLAARIKEGRTAGQRCRGDEGAALVEFAITAPILILLLFGIIDFGFVFNDWISVRQGARDGIRQAIVDPTPASQGSCTIVGTAPTETAANNMVCYTKARVGLNQTNTRVKIVFCTALGGDGALPSGCPSSVGFKSGYPVKICVQYPVASTTGFFSFALSGRVLDTQVESLIETDSDSSTFTKNYFETPIDTVNGWSKTCPNSL